MNAMHNAQCTMHNSGCGGKTARGRAGAGRLCARWAAGLAIVAGTLLGSARDAWANWGDTCYWRNEATSSDWDSSSWYNASQDASWGNHNPGYVGGNKLIFDNTNHPTMQNSWGSPGSNLWQVIFNDGTPSRTITGTIVDTFYDNGGTMPKIENYTTVDQTINFPFVVGYSSGMEINPVHGNLLLKKRVSANGHAINVYGDDGKTAYFDTLSAGDHSTYGNSMTLYVDDASKVSIGQALWGEPAANTWQDINVKDSAGYVTVTNFRYASRIKTEGAGTVEFQGQYQKSGQASIWIAGGTTVLDPSSATVCFTNVAITNGATLVLHKETRIRRVTLNTGCTVQMDVLSQSSAAKLGINQNSGWTSSAYSFNTPATGNTFTLKLVKPAGSTFDATQNATFTVFEARPTGSFSDNEMGTVSLDVSAMPGAAATLANWSKSKTANAYGTANAAIQLTYTAPATEPELSNPTATVTGTTTATLGATVDRNNGLSITDYGIVYSKTATEPTVGGTGCTKAQKGTTTPTSGAAWTLNVTGLEAGTTYYYRGYATSSAGTGYSTVGTFTTLANQSTAVSVTQLTHTYTGSTITLEGTGGNGTGTAVYTFGTTLKTGTTGTGSLTSAGVLTVTAAGEFVFDVTRAASGSYAARTDEVTVTVNKGTQSISGLSDVTVTYSPSGTFSLSATAVGSVSYEIDDEDVATVAGSTGTIVGAGTATITASAAETALYNAATATATLTVNKAAQTLSVSPTSGKIYMGGSALTLTATPGPGSPTISYAVTSGGTYASVTSGGVVSAVKAGGTATITVTAGETANYGSATATCTVKVHAAVPSAPTGVGVTARTANSMTLGWTKGSGGTYSLAVASLSDTFTAPNDESSTSTYTPNAAYGNGTALGSGYVVYLTNAASPSVSVTALTPATLYHFAVYMRAGSSTYYAFSPAATASAWTFATEPSGQASGLTAGTVGSRKVPMTWSAGSWTAASGETATLKTLLIVVPSGSSVTAPTDGVTYSAGDTIGAGTVAFAGAGTSAEVTGLTPQQTYTIYAYAYAEGADGTTANYLTTSPASRSVTTIASQGPNVQATGVDTTGYLLNWSQLSSDSAGYDVDTRASGGSWASAGRGLPGYNKPVTGLTSGSTYEARVRKNPDGDWSDELSVKAGVKPNTVSSTATRNSVTFTWTDVQSGAVGYGVQVTKTAAAASLYTKTCPSSALGRNSFSSGQQWKYTGDQITCTSQNFSVSPGYRSNYGHIIIGTGQTLESDAFALDGMTALQLNFTIKVHNSDSGSDNYRVNAYYKIDDGVWNWLGSANTAAAHTLTVPQGAIDEASTISFKLVAPNAHVSSSGGSFVCPAIDSISVTATAKGAGDYDSPVTETTTTSRSYTVNVGGSGTSVYFRVQALQGSTANPTAKSVWVEGTGTTTAYTPPSGLTLSSVTRNSMTATWSAGDTYQLDHYVVEWSTSSTFATTAGSANVAAGTLTKAIAGLTANTTYYVRVRAVGTDSQTSAWSGTANAKTQKLGATTISGATATASTLALTWSAVTGATAYEVQCSTSSSFSGAETVTVSGTSKTFEGLMQSTTYYYRVRAKETGVEGGPNYGDWTSGSTTTTAWGGPTGLDFTARGRYSLTAEWDAIEGNGVTYSVDLTSCAADPSEASLDCTEESLSWGSSESAWTYQRSMSGSTSGAYPQWNSGSKFHLLLGQWGTVTTHPGIESPRLNLSGASSARVTFKHRYYNNGTGTNSLGQYYSALYEKPRSTVTVYYKVGSGSWVSVGTTAAATVYSWSGAGTERSIDLPAAALVANVKVKVVAEAAHAYTTDAGTYKATGPIIEDLAVVTMTSGGVDYDCGTAQHFTGLTTSSQEFTGLTMDTPYYVRVKVVSNGVSSVYSEAMGSTLEGPAAPASVWADAVKQTTMRVEWDEPDDATAGTRYKLQVSSCKGTDWTREAVTGSATNRVLAEDDDWSYIGGGTAVEDLESGEQGYFSGSSRKVLPTWTSTAVEASQVLAGSGEPGLQSAVFSTVGATNVSLVFGHGRWYATADADKPSTTVTLSYSTDGGASWTEWATNGPTTKAYWYSDGAMVTKALPADALGKPEVAVRIVAKAAGFQAAASTKACGAAIGDAKVVAQGAEFNESCLVPAACAEGLTELSQALTGLSPDTTYYFRVAASDGMTSPLQYGAWTEGAAKTLAAPAKPDVPWAESVGTHGFTMLWKAVEGAEAYNVKVYTSGNESSPVFARDGVSGTTVQVTGLNPNTTYYMKVQAVGDITTVTSAWSDAGSQTTLDGVHVTGLRVENETLNSLDVVWDNESGLTYKLDWGTADATGETVAETLECPNETLKRSDSGKGWFYIGGSASWPSYYVGSAANDKGHGLIYTTGGAPGLQSRWFSTRGASKVTVTFNHGRFNATANSAVTLSYSLDEGKTWTVAGTSGTSSSTVPTDSVTMELPPAAMNQKTVAVRLTAESADGNKGAHVNNVKVNIWCGQGSTGGSGLSVSGGRYTLSGGSVTPGTRYWFRLTGTEGSESDVKTTSGATHEAPATFWKSQGFDGYDSGSQALSYSIKYRNMSDGAEVSHGASTPTVEVVDNENPLYGNKVLRFSGSASATVFGVAEFDVGSVSGRDGVLTIPFAAKDLGKNDYLYFSYSIDGGTTWLAPAGATEVTTMGGAKMGRIGVGGSDVLNQNWAYNKGTNTTTRPQGDAFQWVFPAEVRSASTLKFRLAFCGQSGGAAHYYYVDNISLLANAGIPAPVSATERDDGGVDLTWTPPTGQDVIIVCGKDQRNPPPSPLDLHALPAGYHVVMNGDSTVWPNGTASTTDYEVAGGDRYYYYFYAVLNGQIGLTPATAYASPKGMVLAIASQGWDGWDVHPWSYRVGRVTNPGRSSDYGWWKANGMNTVPVAFIEGSYEVSDTYYASGYYGGTGSDKNKQIGATDWTNYYGENCLRMSGSQGFTWNQSGTYIDYSGNEVEFSNPHINTTNAAIEFANVDLSGYKNVRFSMHFAGRNLNGGNDLHVAISTNGGATGTWLEVGNNNDAGWRVYESHQDYGRAISDGDTRLGGDWSFYFEDSARATPYGNPYVLQVPDSVTQIMVRVMFYDSNGGSRQNATYFVDEVRLTGEVAMETPRPVITNITKTTATVKWDAVPDATSYNVKVTKTGKSPATAKVTEAFVVERLVNGWTATGDGLRLVAGADHGGQGFGVELNADDEGVISPEVGAASTLTFWAKKTSGLTRKLVVYALDTTDGTDTGTWVKLKEIAAGSLSTSWAQQTVSLPSRQYQKVKICVEKGTGSAGTVYVDDIEILGGGDYTTTTTTYTGITELSKDLTGLTEGARFWVSVQAYGAPAGVETYSGWGETAEYTPGTVYLQPDGFEMVRMWGNASSSMNVLIATSAGNDPIGTPEGGVTYAAGNTLPGGGTVIARWTSNYTENNNFEHVVPANAQVNYAVFWKRGDYYEGRYDTNFWMGNYGSDAADAIAQTNATAAANLVANGKGWGAGWSIWDDGASYVSVARESNTNSTGGYGLVGSRKLYGAGGDFLRFTMEASDRALRAYRPLETAVTSGDVWMMVTLRSESGGDNADKKYGIQLMSGTTSDTIFAFVGKGQYLYDYNGGHYPTMQIDTSKDDDRKFPKGTGITWGALNNGATRYDLGDTESGSGHQGQHEHTLVIHYNADTGLLKASALYTRNHPNFADIAESSLTWYCQTTISGSPNLAGILLLGYGWNNSLDFDEVRVGPTWNSLIKEPAPPRPVTAAHAVADGKELVRLDWTYAAHNDAYPDAGGVLVLDKETAWTAEDIAAIKPVNGQRYNAGATVGGAKVAYLGNGWTAGGVHYMDAVVAPGSTHYYAFYAHSGYIYTNGVAASTQPGTMETYRAGEHVVPFSYTNATTEVGSWQGGVGFTGGWSGTGTWTAMLPLEQPGSNPSSDPVLADVTGYPARAGNAVMATDPGNGGTATLTRALDTAVTASQTNFYAAFMMAYEWKGSNKWAGVSILNGSDQEIGFAGKGSGANWNTLAVASDLTAHWSQTDLLPYDPSNADSSGALSHAYLVVMRYNFANRTLSALAVPCGGEMPEYEPTQWDVSWQVREGLGSSVAKIQLNVGSSDSGGTIGYCWFDELRWGTRWEDIVSGKCADGVDVAQWRVPGTETALTETYLGNSADIGVKSHPKGFGQEAWLTVDWSGNGTGVVTNQLAWLKNIESGTPTYTWWSNTVQMVKTGKVGGTSSVDYPATAKVTALNTDCEVTRAVTQVTVLPLQPPTGVSAAKDAVKTNSVINVSWTPWQGTLTGVDTHTKDVLVVRFSGATEAAALAKAALAANQPVQGRAYSAGDSIGEGTVVWRGGDEGRVRTAEARGLQPETCYAFAVYTENYSYYSAAAYASATTDAGGHDITVDGDPTDWYGEAPDTLNTAWVNLGEFIWKDKTGEERHSAGSGGATVGNPNSDIDEFRIYADADWVYFLVKMTNITDVAKPYVAVGMDSRKKASSEEMNWLGDESATTIGSNYWANTANEHYPRWQLNVHQVAGQGTQVEQYAADGTEWYAPVGTVTTTEGGTSVTRGWAAAIGSGVGQAVEFRVARSDIGLAGIEDGAAVTQRFTVASFVNTGVWNNQGGATAEIYGGTSKAVDALGIAPQRPASKPDNDYLLSSWDEDIADGNIDFWVDVAFSKSGVVENQRPSAPSQLVFPTEDARLKSSPTFEWKRGSDTDGKVTGYMLEVSTNADFNDLNGTVALRVNVPALVTGETDSTKYHYAWSGAHQQTMYYWRVRSRDTGGMLSTPASGRFWVDEDGDGPVAVLKYVGTDVNGYMAGNYAQQEKLWPESLLSVTDAEIERVVNDSNLKFGFVIEWTDPNGVYATNHLHDGAGANKGKWAWNIASGDGRVSPNWDLVEFHTTLTDRNTTPPDGLVTDTTGHGEWTTNYWDETGCWGYQWGYDEAFSVGTAGTAADQTRGANGDPTITNLVRSAFDMHAFDTNVDYYLTVSAEDCTTWKESGYDWWEYGTWKSFKDPSDPDAPGSRYSSGWCADGPNRARNVTTNQLLKIQVRDNDVTAPGASLNRWSTTSFIASTNDATPTFANPEKQLTRESGTGLPTFVTTDGELAGRPLALHFNVYDSSMTGIKLGTAETETVAGLVGSHTMTNSWLVRTQQVGDAEPDVMTNRANYVAGKSTLESSGTGAGTVLTWYWPTMDAENIAHFWATNAVDEGGVLTETVNTLALNLWDLDNNRDGDQMGAETVMGYLKVRDDDTSAPVARDMHTLGTGTNRVVFGLLARWPMATNEATNGRKCSTINEQLTGAVVDNGLSGSGHGTLKFFATYSMWGYENINTGNPQRAVKFPLTASTNAQWESEALSFKFRTTKGGPTNLAVKVKVGSAAERDLGTIQVEKDLDANGDHADTTTDVTVLFAGADKVTCLAGQTATFRIIADGLETDSSSAQFGEFKVYGVVSLPPGTEVTDQDMRTATWTNSVDVSDGAQGKTDTLRSGLWLAHSAAYTGAAEDEPVPKYVLEDASTHEAITNGLTVSGLTAAFENEVADGDFETDFTSPGSEWSKGGGAEQVTDATGGNHVLKFTANGASATKVLDLGDVTGATAIRAKCDQVEYKGGRVRLTYVWLDEDGDEVEAESAAHSTANDGWEIWVPRNQSVSAANLEAGTVRKLEVTFTREDSLNEADLDDILVYAEVVTASGTRTVPATPADDDFESEPYGWELSDGASVALGGAVRTGSHAVEVSATTDVVQNWVAVEAAEGLLQGSMLGSVWTRGAAAAVEVRFFKAQAEAETTPLTDWLTVAVPATVDWARTEIPATIAGLSETGLTRVYGLVRVRGGGSGATFVDDLEMVVVGWGSPTAGATVENGTKSAALQFTTANLVDARGKLSLPGGVAVLPKDYNFGVQVADYDLDRTQDHLVTTSGGSFRLFDDDATAPQAGMMFGGSLGVRTGDAKAPYAGVGTDVDVRLSDGAMVAAGSSAQVAFDLDFYDYSGWDTLGLSWYPATEAGGAHTLVWTNGSGSMASALKTKGDGEANSPSATNTVTVPVSTLWGLTAVQEAFTTGIVSNWMAATITDKDADRDGDELVWTNKVGMLTFLDDDVKAPKLGSTNRWPRQMFVGKGSVSALAAATNNYAAYRRAWPRDTTYADDVPASGRTTVVYDGELRTLATENLFIEVDMNDPSDSMKGRSATGLRRGTARTVTGQSNGLGDTYVTTNTWLGLFAESGADASSYASATPVIDATDKYSSADSTAEDHTKGSLGVMWNVWKWTANLEPEAVAAWLPSGSPYRDLRAVVHAYDADTDRPGDQLESVIVGQVIRVRDDDTVAPGAVGDIMNNGVNITYTGSTLPSRTDPGVKWTNNLSSMTLTFTAAADGAKGADDLNVSGIGGYRLADATPTAATDGTALACTVSDGTVTADLGDSEVTQGLTAEYVFAVDADNDRPGDALAGTAKGFVLAYDITKPTAVAPNGSATVEGDRLVADPESTDDPTTQFDLTWPIDGIGPDDKGDTAHYNAIPKKYKDAATSDIDVLSPWYSYKIYYGTFDESSVPAGDDPSSDTCYIYTTYVKNGAYKTWASVDVSTNAAADPSAPANPYASLGSVAATAGLTGKQRVRLYDLDFDQHYAVVIVGVDKAGNEGPAGMWSWATNNTIKFAVTQGLIRASADINEIVGTDTTSLTNIGIARITDTNVTKAAVLYWKAAGMKEVVTTNGTVVTTNLEGSVSKQYDLIYRDAPSFNERGTEVWSNATTGANSGTSKTNWNYQADAGLSTPGRLRFYRASYHDRWQDTKPGTSEKQLPLASEEVYSMNNIVLSEGFNYVSLQGVPWTNTFRGVFGAADTNAWSTTQEWRKNEEAWPKGDVASITNPATIIEFYAPGTNTVVSNWYFYGKDGKWYDSVGTNVTDTLQEPDFFMRPFGIVLPKAVITNITTNAGVVVTTITTNEWWSSHRDYTNATYGHGTKHPVWATMWHPILQVPTNGIYTVTNKVVETNKTGKVTTNDVVALGFRQTIMRGEHMYNTLALNLPVAVHPRQLGLEEAGLTKGNPWAADQLYVIDSATKEVRGDATMYCDAEGEWRYAKGTYPNYPKVGGTPIQPNDILVLISADGSGTWDWTYTPEQFYTLPDRHMGRKRTTEEGSGEP